MTVSGKNLSPLPTAADGFGFGTHLPPLLGGPAHSFPPFLLFWQEIISFLDSLIVSCVSKNWMDEQQAASNFSTPWKLPPPIAKLRSLSSGAG
jgi:hypothetical protein